MESYIAATIIQGSMGKLSAVVGHHSFFRAVKLEFKTVGVHGLGSGMGK